MTSNQNIQLVTKFCLPDIKRAVQELEKKKNKALGPVGFTLGFILKFWDQLKENFLKLFEEFYSNGKLNSCTKENFICFVQKEYAALIKDLRPISLSV